MYKPASLPRNEVIPFIRKSLSSYDLSGDTFTRIMSSLLQLTSFMERKSIDLYVPDLGVEYLSTLNLDKGIAFRRYQRNRRGIEILNAALSAELNVFFRDKPKRISRLFNGDIGAIAKEYTDLLIKNSFLAPPTIDSHLLYISRFCEFAYTSGKSLSTLQWEDIVAYIDSTGKNRYAKCYPVKLFMRYLYESHFITADLSLAFEGVTQRTRKVPLISYFDKDEILKLEQSRDRTGPIGKRNCAMILLATRLGLRRSDVVNLQFSDLDWDNNQITILQQKTGKRIVLPLLGIVGEALVDYIAKGRPKSKSKFIFLGYCKQRGLLCPMTANKLTLVVSDAMREAELDCRGRHHGPHSLRHSLATTMMNQGVDIHTISGVLGHSSIESTMSYLNVNLKTLSICALDVPLVCETFYNQKGGLLYVIK